MPLTTSSLFGGEGDPIIIPPNSTIQVNFNIAGAGGVLTTLVANILIALLYMLLFFLCCRQLSLFNPRKKKKLFDEYMRDLEEEKAHQQANEEEDSSHHSQQQQQHVENSNNEYYTSASTITNQITSAYQEVSNQYPFNQIPKLPSEPTEMKKHLLGRLKIVILEAFNSTILFFPTMLAHFREGIVSFFVPSKAKQERKKMMALYGKDIVIYLYFQQIILYIMLVCSILACVVLLPIHLSGNPPIFEYSMNNSSSSFNYLPSSDDISLYSNSDVLQKGIKPIKNLTQEDNILLRTTVEMVIDSPVALYAHVVVGIISICVGLFFFFHFVFHEVVVENQSREEIVHQEDSNIISSQKDGLFEIFQETDSTSIAIHNKEKSIDPKEIISPYVVVVKGLPREMTNLKDFESFVEIYFNDNLKVDHEDSKILRSVLIYDFINRLTMSAILKHIEEDLDHFIHLKLERGEELLSLKEHVIFDEGVVDSKNVLSHCFGVHTHGKKINMLNTEEAIQHLETRKRLIRKEVSKWDASYNQLLHTKNREIPKVNSIDSFDDSSFMEDIQIEDTKAEETNNNDPISSIFVNNEGISSSGVAYLIFKNTSHVKDVLGRYLNNEIRLQNNVITIHPLDQEPTDINWYTVCRSSGLTGSRYEGIATNIMIHLFLVLFFIVASSPASILSAIQSLFNVGVVDMDIQKIQRATGIVGSIFFQFLPSFFLYWISRLIGFVISKVTMLGKYDSNQEYKRIYLLRKYFYMVLTILVMPSLWLSSMDGIVNYIKTEENFQEMLANIFLPASGALMVSTAIQYALIGNLDDLIRTEDAFWYIWKTKLSPYRKAKSPLEKLRAATDQFYFSVDTNYAKILAVFTLCMCYSVFIPIILPCGLFYMMMKHWIDRYLLQEIYTAPAGYNLDIIDNKPKGIDFISIQKKVILVVKVFIIALSMSAWFLIVFFGLRVYTTAAFLPHLIISIVVFVLLVCLLYLIHHNEDKIIRKRVMSQVEKQNHEVFHHFATNTAFCTPFEKK
ncbi:transmembrane protein [Naegleria gruberi]|uniref:Transmembrane protein n=1 Tax=Naegleria gruberi TaxID=5762 RepID=D2W109_NAEGR|nr:uncharacterized protein NAEGRDRAFT_81987 [Naegleria gruberi]EFC37276.1 transmembrane protein [Naegleria gruberi]|eukprot:XP_002670020.1 transmembrane protein [Naegleria gruberi strain NEG-M]